MIQFDINSFSRNFSPSFHKSWIPVAKIGLGFIVAGFLIMLLKELIIGLLAFGAIGAGIYLLIVSYRIYRLLR
ncbi:MAG: hypothetical protein HQ510_00405 [Candidatus Marinimicrobia bacterium]|nr:hypothetical protein [Candidatus Neomarinimicrobiota bacterium]